METKPDAGEKTILPASGRSLSRREWVQRMLAGAGAGLAAPALAAANSAPTHLTPGSASAAATPAEAAAGEWKPTFFDAHQNQSLIALAERIVPGSTSAQVNRFLDTVLSIDTRENQQSFVASLNALEGESLRHFTKSFKDLSAEQQDEVLTTASTSPRSDSSSAHGHPGKTNFGTPPSGPNLRDYFDHLKDWISMAYYSSEVGMKELGWTGDNFFESFPGCEHAGGHS